MTQTRTPGQKTGGPPRPQPAGSITLTSRGAIVTLVVVCFLSLLLAAVTGWGIMADAVFVMACGLVACYTRASGLRTLVVCPPLAFFTGTVLAQVITAPDGFTAVAGILVTLATSALWLFTGTALTAVIALGRGWRPGRPANGVVSDLREALRDRRAGGDRWVRPRLTLRAPGHPNPARGQRFRQRLPPGDRRYIRRYAKQPSLALGRTPYRTRRSRSLP